MQKKFLSPPTFHEQNTKKKHELLINRGALNHLSFFPVPIFAKIA